MLRAMSAPDPVTIVSSSPGQTAQIAVDLAGVLGRGDTVCLAGDLGAGKSHVARSIIRHLTGETDIPSPTFTLVQMYMAEGFDILHADLYRLSAPDEILELGLGDAIGQDLCLIEWPDRLPQPPTDALWLELLPGATADTRDIIFSHDGSWKSRIEGLIQAWST